MSKGLTLGKIGKEKGRFFCPKEKKTYDDLEIVKRERMKRGGDLLTAIDREGHTVHAFGKRRK